MNIFFSKIIKLGDRQREINFRKLPGDVNHSYHVDTTDDRGNRVIFSIYKDASGHWVTSDPIIPTWIHGSEEMLGNIIEEEVKSYIL